MGKKQRPKGWFGQIADAYLSGSPKKLSDTLLSGGRKDKARRCGGSRKRGK